MYDGPELDNSKIAIVKGASDKIKILRVDWEKIPGSFWLGYPDEVHILPGDHSIFAAYELSARYLAISPDSDIKFKAEPGKIYNIQYRPWHKLSFIWLTDTKGNMLYKKDDLVGNIDEINNKYANSFYKLDKKLRTDFFVSQVRQRAFEFSWSRFNAAILISFGLLNDNDFNCDQFYAKLTEEQRKSFNELMTTYPFICKHKNYSAKDAEDAFKDLLKQEIITASNADANWAWFAATGNINILKRFLDSYLYVSDACRDCIQWSYSSMAAENKDVENYLLDYMKSKPKAEADKLKDLLPAKK